MLFRSTYIEEGYLWKKHTYRNRQLNGKFVNYYTKTGVEETVGNYVNGKKSGNWNSYYSSGRKKLSGDYSNGHRQGVFTEWYENGLLMQKKLQPMELELYRLLKLAERLSHR